jgi:hypothetical protein
LSLRRYSKLKPKQGRRECYRDQEDHAYRRWIRSLPCTLSGREVFGQPHQCSGRIEAAHVGKTQANGAADRGELLPLCTLAHTDARWSWHRGGPLTFCRRFNLDALAVAAELLRRYEQEEGL